LILPLCTRSPFIGESPHFFFSQRRILPLESRCSWSEDLFRIPRGRAPPLTRSPDPQAPTTCTCRVPPSLSSGSALPIRHDFFGACALFSHNSAVFSLFFFSPRWEGRPFFFITETGSGSCSSVKRGSFSPYEIIGRGRGLLAQDRYFFFLRGKTSRDRLRFPLNELKWFPSLLFPLLKRRNRLGTADLKRLAPFRNRGGSRSSVLLPDNLPLAAKLDPFPPFSFSSTKWSATRDRAPSGDERPFLFFSPPLRHAGRLHSSWDTLHRRASFFLFPHWNGCLSPLRTQGCWWWGCFGAFLNAPLFLSPSPSDIPLVHLFQLRAARSSSPKRCFFSPPRLFAGRSVSFHDLCDLLRKGGRVVAHPLENRVPLPLLY